MHGPNSDKTCATCGQALITFVEQRDGVCSNLPCRGPYLQRVTRARRVEQAAERAELVNEATRIGDQCCGRTNESALVVPVFEENLQPLPQERRTSFEVTLQEALDAALVLVSDPDNHDGLLMEYSFRHLQHEASLTVINACTTCRGACCTNGREHAFLRPRFLAWRLLQEPGLTTAEMFADYTARMPGLSHEESCVYHGERGCVLPREIRGSTCNDFLCTGIVDHSKVQADPDVPSLAIGFDVDKPIRAGRMDAHGNREEFDLSES